MKYKPQDYDNEIWEITEDDNNIYLKLVPNPDGYTPELEMSEIDDNVLRLNGYYKGNREFGATEFTLFKNTKFVRPGFDDNGESFFRWKSGYYAWDLHGVFKYNGKYYIDHVNFR
jgi:hypothetical protein